MTLRCKCGGAVEIVRASYDDESAAEQYQCEECGRKGQLLYDSDTERMSGCLTAVDGRY